MQPITISGRLKINKTRSAANWMFRRRVFCTVIQKSQIRICDVGPGLSFANLADQLCIIPLAKHCKLQLLYQRLGSPRTSLQKSLYLGALMFSNSSFPNTVCWCGHHSFKIKNNREKQKKEARFLTRWSS